MRNKDSAVGAAEDLIGALRHQIAIEHHLEIIHKKTMARVKNGLYNDSLERTILDDKLLAVEEYKIMATKNRQRTQRYLRDLIQEKEAGDDEFWCLIKHSKGAVGMLEESFMATGGEDPDLEEIVIANDELFNLFLTEWLGLEVTACAACVADSLDSVEDEKDGKNETREINISGS